MNVALAHHWLTHYRGGEKVLEQIATMFAGSDIYTLVHNRSLRIPLLEGHAVIPSKLDRLPAAQRLYRHLLPAHPWAIKNLRVPDHVDVLLSSDAALMKGITVAAHTNHVCYCHSPPRYLWELSAEYKKTSVAARMALDKFAPMLRRFDYDAAQQVTHFIANSHFVSDRIRKYYHRESTVIYPPVAVDEFRWDQPRQPYALVVSELVPYKRIDIAVEAFNRLGKKLVVIGDGPERKRLESTAKSNIQFLGRQPFSTLKSSYQSADMFIFPGIEDFGITPVEAQAAGCPVIAFGAGGALETVIDGQTGAYFEQQDPECLADTISSLDENEHDPQICAAHAQSFSTDRFRERYRAHLADVVGKPAPVTLPIRDRSVGGVALATR